MSDELNGAIGPALYFRGYHNGRVNLAVLIMRAANLGAPAALRAGSVTVQPGQIAEFAGLAAWRYDFSLSADDTGYQVEGAFYPVSTQFTGDMRIAFVSCNGEESGDLDRDVDERNAMWARLNQQHETSPFALLLQGGDQIYADEVTKGHPLSDDWPEEVPPEASGQEITGLLEHLRRQFAQRYLDVMGTKEYAWILARVPSLAIWDDHDICDGWGSLRDNRTDSAVGQAIFRAAREAYLLFQHAATDADIADLFWEPTGRNLGWQHHLPGLSLIAPDLRSERTRRRIMGEAGWQAMRQTQVTPGQSLMVFSVPLLGPRLSLVEFAMMVIPRTQDYEDDLRDQWQSRTHRSEWREMLNEVLRLRKQGPVTAISGEIHLATRAEMGRGADKVHQLVASGISHRAPPKAYANSLGLLAGLGEAPLAQHPIRIKRLPGQKRRYIAERNFLVLTRRADIWEAVWFLEESGTTPPLLISD